ncbi:protein kinase [Nocardia sp. NPDC050793]|uniref:protein kinase domain-containing protein n=1 Tax=Nocardia sp. NPDC050793 TaxID=3155159 RepID=UPI003403E9AB
MPDADPFTTQRDVGPAVASELRAIGFDDVDEIGRGGFGVVYRCVQPELDRTVAVKVLTAHLDENRERFVREQRAMGRLTGHPNIVGVLQVGETGSGYPYLVMPYYRRGSLEERIRDHGPLPLADVLRLGVRMIGALESAHRAGILHRDIKPGNILYSDYDEPALSDFGIAQVTGAFKTATGTFTGTPAFTAPEILGGDPPTKASDVYGLGSTLFCALTGHAAYERRRGEQVVTQFLRIATESAPDLRDTGIPDDVAAVIEKAMARDPRGRPSALALSEQLRQLQENHGLPPVEMAVQGEAEPDQPARRPIARPGLRSTLSNLPRELTSFVGRGAELAELKQLMTTFPLVTVTGMGGVGKTRLALHAAAEAGEAFPDGVHLVELGELHDEDAVVDVVAAALGLRDDAATPLSAVLIEYVSPRKLLLVLDNCEQVVDAAAKLAETLLRACPDLRILATSREGLGIGGEAVLPLSPLVDDAVTLFAERAAIAVPGFALTEENEATVARICSRLDGLPLAIELAAAKLRALSPEQILRRLDNRYALLTRGSRGAPQRQQTLAWSVGWSYDLCTPAEQELWTSLSVFAGSFELEAAEDICGTGYPEELVDLLTSLVDKSILTRTESHGAVRFRLIETLRDYGREKIRETGAQLELRRRHLDWYRRLTRNASAEWFSSRQIGWIERLDRELPNLREAIEFGLTDSPDIVSRMASDLGMFSATRGLVGEGRRWLDRALAATPREPTFERVVALYNAGALACDQGDLQAAGAIVHQARELLERLTDPVASALVDIAEGFMALVGGDADRACRLVEPAVERCEDLAGRAAALVILGRAHQSRGDAEAALACNRRVLELSEAHGESVIRSWALWSVGIESLRRGDRERAAELLEQGLQLTHRLRDARAAASYLEVLAWKAAEDGKPTPAAVMMAAAETTSGAVGNYAFLFPDLTAFHQECDRRVRSAIDEQTYVVAREKGRSLSLGDAVAYALQEG